MPNSILLDTCALIRLAGYPETLSTAALAGELPLHHRDPADRFIIATAKLHDLPVITTDGNFSKYDIAVIE